MTLMNLRAAVRQCLKEELTRDPHIFLIGEDIGPAGGVFKVTEGLVKEFGEERIRDTPISESAIVGCAIGAAVTGMHPCVEIMFSDFTAVCMDLIVNVAAKLRYMTGGQTNVPLVIRAATGGGISFGAQHSQNLESWFMNVPGLYIAVPSNAKDAKGLLRTALRAHDTVLFFEHKKCYNLSDEVPDDENFAIPFGSAEIKRPGSDVTLVATMYMVHESLAAAEELAKKGIDVEVIDPRTVSPLDKGTILKSVGKTGRLVTVEENTRSCGWGAEVASIVAEEGLYNLKAPIKRVCNLDAPIPFSPALERLVIPDKSRIIDAIREVMVV